MANIKVSEMTEATSFDDGDYAMIVQANQNKKISRENILGDIEDGVSNNTANIGNLTNLNTSDKTNIVSAINSIVDVDLYSTTEIQLNSKWIDNKPIYRKCFNIGNLPNNTTKQITHGISNMSTIIKINGTAIRSTDNDTLPIPYITFNANNSGGIVIYIDSTNIVLRTTTDRSAYVGYITLEYTKTTD